MKNTHSPKKRIYEAGAPFSSDIIVNENEHLRFVVKVFSSISVLIIFAVMVLAVALAFISNRPPITLSYTTDENGKVVQIEPVEQPYSLGRISRFISKSTERALHLSFTDYEDHLASLEKLFTRKGYGEYQELLIKNGWIDLIDQDNLTMWVELKTAPKFVKKGLEGSHFEYDAEFQVDLFIGGGKESFQPTRLKVEVKIMRTLDSIEGLKIKRFLISEIEGR